MQARPVIMVRPPIRTYAKCCETALKLPPKIQTIAGRMENRKTKQREKITARIKNLEIFFMV